MAESHFLSFSPPATVRIRNFLDNAYVFLGLYVTTFFSVSVASHSKANLVSPHLQQLLFLVR